MKMGSKGPLQKNFCVKKDFCVKKGQKKDYFSSLVLKRTKSLIKDFFASTALEASNLRAALRLTSGHIRAVCKSTNVAPNLFATSPTSLAMLKVKASLLQLACKELFSNKARSLSLELAQVDCSSGRSTHQARQGEEKPKANISAL